MGLGSIFDNCNIAVIAACKVINATHMFNDNELNYNAWRLNICCIFV